MNKLKCLGFFGLTLSLLLVTWSGQALANQIHTVQPGETLWRLSQQWQVSVEEIRVANGLTSDLVKVGQRVAIPEKAKTASGSSNLTSIYQVNPKDTMFSLASRFGLSVQEIKAANGLTSDIIQIGQVLIIPQTTSRGGFDVRNTRNNLSKIPERIIRVSPQKEQPVWSGEKNIPSLVQKYLGTPYVYGSTNPEVGFDCSGFTQHVYSLLGVKIPRTSYDQFTVGTNINRENLVCGDLVFFNTGSGVSHVGIYLENDNFASATLSRGIAVDSLNSSYWASRYVGARRVL